MSKGWDLSAKAWIASLGERGDWGREHVLDPVMLSRVAGRGFKHALDVGCGEGRFCRMLKSSGVIAIGIDPTQALIEQARRCDPSGDYRLGRAEQLQFEAASFDLVVSYLTLPDIDDFRTAIREMSRVLMPGGSLLIANLTSFTSAGVTQGWMDGLHLHHPVDRYLDEFSSWFEWSGIRVENWHRPLGAYMGALLESGLQLSFFSEPEPASGEAPLRAMYRQSPWFMVMEWQRPLVDGIVEK